MDPNGVPTLPPAGAWRSRPHGRRVPGCPGGRRTSTGGSASGPTIVADQENGAPIIVSDPVAVAPVVVATGLAGSIDTSLQQAVDDAITTLLEGVRWLARAVGSWETTSRCLPWREALPSAEGARLPRRSIRDARHEASASRCSLLRIVDRRLSDMRHQPTARGRPVAVSLLLALLLLLIGGTSPAGNVAPRTGTRRRPSTSSSCSTRRDRWLSGSAARRGCRSPSGC